MTAPRGSSLVLPLVNLDTTGTDLHPATGLLFGGDGGHVEVTTLAGLPVVDTRRDAWIATEGARRFNVTNVVNTPVAAQSGFTDTTPTLLLRQLASSRRIVFRSLEIGLTSGGGGNQLRAIIAIDTADRFSAGGTTHTPVNLNEESATASAVTAFLSNPTVTAAGAGTRYVNNIVSGNPNGGNIMIDYNDGIFLGTTSSFLAYVFTISGGVPSIFFNATWEEIT